VRNARLRDLAHAWTVIRTRAGFDDVRIHDLRHSFASRALALGGSLPMIGKLLGHRQVETPARYAHLARDTVKASAARIGDSIDNGVVAGDMIAYRHADPRFPFLREDSSRSAGRWNAPGELTHYFCDTPDGAWAEFLRHEEIRDPQDLSTVRRALWAVDIGAVPSHRPDMPRKTLTGGPDTWPACQQAARRLREHADGVATPSAALKPGAAHGWRVDGGAPTRLRPGRGGLRVVRPPPGRHRLGHDRRRPSEPGSPPQGPTFPAG